VGNIKKHSTQKARDRTMAAYLVVSVMTGIAFAAIGLLSFDAGFLGTALWYVGGCWAGFAAAVALHLLSDARSGPDQAEMRPEYG
jgi:hypothetical protein